MTTYDGLPPAVARSLQRKLDNIGKAINRLAAEVREHVGEDGKLFFEADGVLHIMDGDDHGSALMNPSAAERQKHVLMSTSGYVNMGVGAW